MLLLDRDITSRTNMGININTNRILYTFLELLPQDVDMLLIGDLFIRAKLRNGFKKANLHYRNKGFRSVTSMDINGNADISIDLSKPIDKEYHNTYRALINGGTGEHIEDQEVFYQNCNDMAKLGALMIHVGPEEGSFKGHSDIYYTEDFYYRLAEQYRYMVCTIERIFHNNQGWAIYAAFRK